MIFFNFFQGFITWLNQYIEVASIIAPIISGENGVIALAFLSAKKSFPLFKVIFFSFLGMLIIDSFWFYLIKLPLFEKIKTSSIISKKYKKLEKRIETVSGKNDIFILLISKILIGTRILVIIYISLRNFNYRKFISYDIIPTFLWATILGLLGWFAGVGYYSLSKITDNLFILSISLIVFIAVIYLIIIGARKWILK